MSRLDEAMEELRRAVTHPPTGQEDVTCASCFGFVAVVDGDDWEDGDLCHHCSADVVLLVRAYLAAYDEERSPPPRPPPLRKAAPWEPCDGCGNADPDGKFVLVGPTDGPPGIQPIGFSPLSVGYNTSSVVRPCKYVARPGVRCKKCWRVHEDGP